jgi:hypothetical protein
MKITKRRVTKTNRIKRKYSKKRTRTRHSRKRVFSKKRRKTIKKKKRGGFIGSTIKNYNKNRLEKKKGKLENRKGELITQIDNLNSDITNVEKAIDKLVIKDNDGVLFVRRLASNFLEIKNFLNDNSNDYSLKTKFAKDKSYEVINESFSFKPPYLLRKNDIKYIEGEGLLPDMYGMDHDVPNNFKDAYERKLYEIRKKITNIINTEIEKLETEKEKLQAEIEKLEP